MDGLFYSEALDGVLPHPHAPAPAPHPEAGGTAYDTLTRHMSLNLADAHDALALTSPDLQLLKLTSPELERLIIQSCATPGRAFAAPKPGAHEHDAFGALEEFQGHHRVSGGDPAPAAACTGFPGHLSHAWDAYPDAPPPPLCAPPPPHPPPHPQHFACAPPAVKDEPQKVPETPPLSPIDMEDQERIKAERKRMRNRVAASKCRKRKLERLARLEERVSRLTGENGELRGAADTLRDQVAQLRHQLLEHIKSGCKLLSQQLQTGKEF